MFRAPPAGLAEPMLRTDEITPFLARQPLIVRPLATVAALGIEDCWIGAGLIRKQT